MTGRRRDWFCLIVVCLVVVTFSCVRQEEKGPAPQGAAEVNRPAPQFTLADAEGKSVSLNDHKGKVVMLEFFTTWCGPCQMAAPELQSLHERYKDRGLVLLAVSMDVGSKARSAVASFRKEHGLAYPVLMDTGEVSRLYGVFTIPTSFIIDKNGTVRSKHMGFAPSMSQEMSKEVEALL
jgi:peroxiredoxin